MPGHGKHLVWPNTRKSPMLFAYCSTCYLPGGWGPPWSVAFIITYCRHASIVIPYSDSLQPFHSIYLSLMATRHPSHFFSLRQRECNLWGDLSLVDLACVAADRSLGRGCDVGVGLLMCMCVIHWTQKSKSESTENSFFSSSIIHGIQPESIGWYWPSYRLYKLKYSIHRQAIFMYHYTWKMKMRAV